ncbi:unnamed protein product [Ectocarpus sp. CCAP 1310/34]|nr:unnamed protein product [Ectocarpus sp. CCAP 1310/34]
MSDLSCVTDGCCDFLFGSSDTSVLCCPLSLLTQDFLISALTGRAAVLHKPTSFGLPGLPNTLALNDFVEGDCVRANQRSVAPMGSRMRG